MTPRRALPCVGTGEGLAVRTGIVVDPFDGSDQRRSAHRRNGRADAQGTTGSENQQQQQRTTRQRVEKERTDAACCMPIPYGKCALASVGVRIMVRCNPVRMDSTDHDWSSPPNAKESP